MKQPNFKQDILFATAGEQIETVIILDLLEPNHFAYPEIYDRDPRDTDTLIASIKTPLTWEQAAPLLDYTYDDGFGSMDCHDVVIYTKDAIYYIHEYDGSTSIYNVLRDPSKY